MSAGKEKKAALLEEKLQLLRSVTNSNAVNKTSILVDASKYIKELKDKVEEAAAAASSQAETGITSAMPATVSVSSLELDSNSSCGRRGFRIHVTMERSRPGLLVSVLEAFEDLGLDVLDADVSCADDTAFRLQALGSGGEGQQGGSVDEQMVRQAVLQAISKCMGGGDE
ncbi:hypothetical protein BAE44_0010673 [Dichanthelium oligosanthes]|uniref:Plant bHLH transcription factor ACT-like domain-containing protein n=1 Tax=Dichanthelium oligosanthes TaxID=888268 RepID=A0A1E5VT52_9POAL|nr:hypothetical protein BAE44_0010673 [Dichanthelium oligosanthes]